MSKMKSVIYSFDPVIYPFKLLVTKEFDSKELSEMFYCVDENENLDDAPDEFVPNRRTIARTLEVADKENCQTYMLILLCKPKLIGQGTISHESYHVINIVAEWLGFLPKKSSEDEPMAYLIQWVSNCIEQTLKGHPERMEGTKMTGKDE